MSRIIHQTDRWGPSLEDHLEIKIGGERFFVTISDDKIEVSSDLCLVATQRASNVVTVVVDRETHPAK